MSEKKTRNDAWLTVRDAMALWHGEMQADLIAETVMADLEAEGFQYEGWAP